jgi:5-formyltetrahydrofolate cyclo-ligase
MKKSELRKIYLARQKALPAAERKRKSAKVIKLLFENFDFSKFHFINCFITLEKNNELNTCAIFQKIWRELPNIQVCAPRIDFEIDFLENVGVTRDSMFIENKWQILEPSGDNLIEIKNLDAVLTPLLAFDKRGFRCGYGKGFYDRFLQKCRPDCQKIGLSLFPPVEKISDATDLDVPLDFCVAPEKIWRF